MARPSSSGGRPGTGNRGNVVDQHRPVMNDEIRFQELRVVTPNPKGKDEALGVMSKSEALAKAKELGNLDLILINDKSDPPVCKIVDYSKFRYNQEKKAKELKKNSKVTEVKEIKMSYNIDVHDFEVRKRNIKKFLAQGNRVKCTIMFRGREVQHDKLGFELLDKLSTDLEKLAISEGKPKREGKNLSVILQPRPEVMKAINDLRRAEEKARKIRKAESRQSVAADGTPTMEDLTGMTQEEIDAEDDDEDDDDDDEDDDEDDGELLASSLDELLQSDDLTNDLFKS
jgi:translation initiation factor IF-3